jgi:hypothetical protein
MSAQYSPNGETEVAAIPKGLRILAVFLRALFFGALVAVTVRLSSPQSETIWTVYETPGDLIRLALGFAVCLWLVIRFHISQDGRGIPGLGLSRPCGRPACIGDCHCRLAMTETIPGRAVQRVRDGRG